MNNRFKRVGAWLLVGAFLAVAALIYMPGLAGGFIYDDSSFVVDNAAVHVTTTDRSDWVAAAFSFPGGFHQGRWLGMLSFAANHYFSGLDPFAFKITNLGVHLVNGLLVFLMLRALFALWRECRPDLTEHHRFDGPLAAAVLAGLWLVLPINLTAVLYVSQRLESLSNTFVFLGLAWYLHARLRYWRGQGGSAGLWLSLVVCSGIGVLVKESAAMLPLYAGVVEWIGPRARNRDGRASRQILVLYAVLLLLPLLGGIAWLGTWLSGPGTYARPFDTWERLLTEARVLVDYVRWTLAPSLDQLTLYHDDFAVSHGLLDPPATIAAIAGIGVLVAAAIWQRRRRPLFALGVAWFFCGHLLTATVIPLLLAFEHRNYFPSVGLLLATASLVSLEGPMRRMRVRVVTVAAVFGFYAFTTWMRAEEWSQPLRLASSEASKRPRSPLAQYERAAALMGAGNINGRPVVEDALLALEDHRSLPGAGINYEAALIALNTRMGRPVDTAWWPSLLEKLRSRPPSTMDANSLEYLSVCFVKRECKDGLPLLAAAYSAALAHPGAPALLLSSHAEFAWHLQGNLALAEREFRAAVARSPLDVQARRHLVLLLIAAGKLDAARAEIDAIRHMNHFGLFDRLIDVLDRAVRAAQHAPPS